MDNRCDYPMCPTLNAESNSAAPITPLPGGLSVRPLLPKSAKRPAAARDPSAITCTFTDDSQASESRERRDARQSAISTASTRQTRATCTYIRIAGTSGMASVARARDRKGAHH